MLITCMNRFHILEIIKNKHQFGISRAYDSFSNLEELIRILVPSIKAIIKYANDFDCAYLYMALIKRDFYEGYIGTKGINLFLTSKIPLQDWFMDINSDVFYWNIFDRKKSVN